MFSNILLATDGSEHARRAAEVAAEVAQQFDARVTITHVYHPSNPLQPYGMPRDQAELDFIKKQQDDALCTAGHIVDGRAVVYQTRRENGHPVEQIVQVAKQTHADLIVLGSRGLSDFRSFLLGSISDGVLHHAHCPVLIVRGKEEIDPDKLFTRILLASDGSECALKAAKAAATLAAKFDALLTIANVYQPVLYTDPYGGTIGCGLEEKYVGDIQDDAISSAGRVVDAQNVSYQTRKVIGLAAAEIVRIAEEEKSDLIVLGSHGLSGVKAFLIGSVSDRVAHHAPCPVLIIK